jgi:hypothetical protein
MIIDQGRTWVIRRRAGPRRRTWAWIALGAILLALLVFVRVTIADPRVHVRWSETVSAEERAALERRYDLRNGRPVDATTTTWRYDLAEPSRENIRALIRDPAVDDTAYIDRGALTSEGRDLRVEFSSPFGYPFDRLSQLPQLHRSLWLLLAGGILLSAARASSGVRRRNVTVATLLLVGVIAVALPLDPSFVTMGGSADHVRSREDFESWFGGRVRFEKHLSQVALLQLYLRSDATAAAPERTVITMTRFATAWFVSSALAIGLLERWSALAVRYIALVLLTPATLLFFGWRELGYLSLNIAVFPLLARGLSQGGMRLEAASALAGVGAAFHGSGLVSLAGAWMSALGASGRLRERVDRVLRVTAWGTAAYVGWVAIYIIVLKLPITPDPGPAAFSPWRPWSVDEIREGRVSAAILSATGARDLLMSAWVIGAPLLVVALSLWRQYAPEVRAALWYLPPSILFVIFRWPFEGVGGGMDLVVAGFPALYALAWVCAHDVKRTNIAAMLLISAHYAFWRVVLDDRFEP